MKYFVYNKLTCACDTFTDITSVASFIGLHRNTVASKLKNKAYWFEENPFIIGLVMFHKSKRHGNGKF